MTARKLKSKKFVKYHRDGSVWAQGKLIGDVPTGNWVWFRKDGTRLRSGRFVNGKQAGEWTTYDKSGAVYKITTMK